MKPLYIYASRLRSFWVLLPMSFVLMLAIRFNSISDHWLKLYPLIVFCSGAIIFTFVFLFRFISISFSEVKYIGRFTSRDSATVTEGKHMEIEMLEKRRVSIRLYGDGGYNPDIKWLTNDNGEVDDICLFRGRAYGHESVARAILLHFGADAEDMNDIFESESFSKTYEFVTVESTILNDHRLVKIRFDQTI